MLKKFGRIRAFDATVIGATEKKGCSRVCSFVSLEFNFRVLLIYLCYILFPRKLNGSSSSSYYR